MKWTRVKVAERWRVWLPTERTEGVDWGNWERCRFDSMAKHLRPGDLLYDVGSEWGDVSAAYAQIVGGDSMVLFEPHPEIWTNCRAIWDRNALPTPIGHFVGFASSKTKAATEQQDFDATPRDGWPECAYGERWPDRSFRYITEQANSTPQIRLDDYAGRTGLWPAALTVDVEGFELAVMHGASVILEASKPLVWISIHPDLMQKHCNAKPRQLHEFMRDAGYESEHLGTDHEEHWLFTPE